MQFCSKYNLQDSCSKWGIIQMLLIEQVLLHLKSSVHYPHNILLKPRMISVSKKLKTKVISYLEPPFCTVMQFCIEPNLIRIVIESEILHILLTNKFFDIWSLLEDLQYYSHSTLSPKPRTIQSP